MNLFFKGDLARIGTKIHTISADNVNYIKLSNLKNTARRKQHNTKPNKDKT